MSENDEQPDRSIEAQTRSPAMPRTLGFKADRAMIQALMGMPNRSEFIRAAVLAALRDDKKGVILTPDGKPLRVRKGDNVEATVLEAELEVLALRRIKRLLESDDPETVKAAIKLYQREMARRKGRARSKSGKVQEEPRDESDDADDGDESAVGLIERAKAQGVIEEVEAPPEPPESTPPA